MTNRLIPGIQRLGLRSSIAASTEVSFGVINLDNIRTATFTCRLTYGAGPPTAATLNLYYSADGRDYDTVPFASYAVNVTASVAVQESAIFDLPEHGYIEVKISNGDTAITEVQIWYSVARHGDTYAEADKAVRLLEQVNTTLKELKDIIPLRYDMGG